LSKKQEPAPDRPLEEALARLVRGLPGEIEDAFAQTSGRADDLRSRVLQSRKRKQAASDLVRSLFRK
jgi:hypothetical protein